MKPTDDILSLRLCASCAKLTVALGFSTGGEKPNNFVDDSRGDNSTSKGASGRGKLIRMGWL
jgi:hypothetical protein